MGGEKLEEHDKYILTFPQQPPELLSEKGVLRNPQENTCAGVLGL